MQRFRHLLGLAVLLTALGLLPAAARAGSYVLDPVTPSVKAGERIDFKGSGFIKGERVASWATSPDQRVYGGEFAAATGDAGRIEVGFNLPGDAVGGRWAFTVYGEYSKEAVVTTFNVDGKAVSNQPPAISVTPPAGPVGSKFKFYASGFKKLEKASYWFTGPDGKTIAFPEGVEAKKGGDVYFDWVPPPGTAAGRWVVTVQGLTSNVARGIAFDIQ